MLEKNKSTSFMNSRFGVKGTKGLSKGTEKIFNSSGMKKINRLREANLKPPP